MRAELLCSVTPSGQTAGLSDFVALQADNGSWSDDVYTTAIASELLSLASRKYANPDLGGVRGRLVDAEYETALSGVEIVFANRSAITDSTGYFEFEGVAAGNYELAAAVENFQSLAFEIVLGSGQQVNLGDIGLLAAATGVPGGDDTPQVSASLRGTALDLASGLLWPMSS